MQIHCICNFSDRLAPRHQQIICIRTHHTWFAYAWWYESKTMEICHLILELDVKQCLTNNRKTHKLTYDAYIIMRLMMIMYACELNGLCVSRSSQSSLTMWAYMCVLCKSSLSSTLYIHDISHLYTTPEAHTHTNLFDKGSPQMNNIKIHSNILNDIQLFGLSIDVGAEKFSRLMGYVWENGQFWGCSLDSNGFKL